MQAKFQITNRLMSFAEPAILGKPFLALPKYWQHFMIEILLNQLLVEQIQDGILDYIKGKLLTIVITDLELKFGVTFNTRRLKVVSCSNRQMPACSISLNSRTLLKLLLREADPDSLFFHRELLVEGDTAFGLQTKNLLDTIDMELIPKIVRHILHRYYRVLER